MSVDEQRLYAGRWSRYEEFGIGDAIESYGRTISETDLVMFTALIGGFHQPLHTDLEWVKRNTGFAERIVPGPMILSYAISMASATLAWQGATIAGLGFDAVRATRPVVPGDTIRVRARVESKRRTSDGKRGIITLALEVRNQHDEVVMHFDYLMMVRV